MRVLVAIPSHDYLPALFAYDLGQMMGYVGGNYIGPGGQIESLGLTMTTSTIIHTARCDLANLAIETEADYVLWLDSDMRFPKDILIRLLKHRKDIVGINYSNRNVPPDFVAFKTVRPREKLVTGPDSTGLESVEAIGFGAVLMRGRVLHKVQADHPDMDLFWFAKNEENKLVGEDVWFCNLARESGYEIFVDHDLSRECAHIGQLEFRTEHALATREEGLSA
jgi:hypothetical protein